MVEVEIDSSYLACLSEELPGYSCHHAPMAKRRNTQVAMKRRVRLSRATLFQNKWGTSNLITKLWATSSTWWFPKVTPKTMNRPTCNATFSVYWKFSENIFINTFSQRRERNGQNWPTWKLRFSQSYLEGFFCGIAVSLVGTVKVRIRRKEAHRCERVSYSLSSLGNFSSKANGYVWVLAIAMQLVLSFQEREDTLLSNPKSTLFESQK